MGLVEVALDQGAQLRERGPGAFAIGFELDQRPGAELQSHHLDHALRVDPFSVGCATNADNAGKALGELGELDRGPGMQAGRVGDHHLGAHGGHGPSSSAAAQTASSEPPPEASVAATTAPSTMGALQIRTTEERSPSSISIAISA